MIQGDVAAFWGTTDPLPLLRADRPDGGAAGLRAAIHRHVSAVDAAAGEGLQRDDRAGTDHAGNVPAGVRARAGSLWTPYGPIWQKAAALLQPGAFCGFVGGLRVVEIGECAGGVPSAAGDRGLRRRGRLSSHGPRPVSAGGPAPHLLDAGAGAGGVAADRALHRGISAGVVWLEVDFL